MSSTREKVILCDCCHLAFQSHNKRVPENILGQLRTGYTLSNEETYAIHDSIAEAQSELARYNEELRRLDSIMARLKKERRVLNKYINAHRALISPIRRLPTEILSAIFTVPELTSWLSRNKSPHAEGRPSRLFPLNLGLVCRLWRNIALSTPSLWDTIMVDLARPDPRTADILRLHIRHSNQNPLTVHVMEAYPAFDIHAIGEVLIPTAHRWRSLCLWGVCHNFLTYASLLDLSLSELENLEFQGGKHPSGALLNVLGLLPKLQTLSVGANMQLKTFPPLQQISSLSLCSEQDGDLYEVLPACPRLLHVELCAQLLFHRDTPPLTLHLTSLVLTLPNLVARRDGSTSFFASLTLPRLESFAIVYNFSVSPEWPADDFLSFLSRSKCSLKSLSFLGIHVSDEALVEILSTDSAASITELKIHDPPSWQRSISVPAMLTPTLFRSLIHNVTPIHDSSPNLLPFLAVLQLKFRGASVEPHTLSVLESMIRSRRTPYHSASADRKDSHLQYVSILFASPPDPASLQPLQQCLQPFRRTGCRISVSQQ